MSLTCSVNYGHKNVEYTANYENCKENLLSQCCPATSIFIKREASYFL